MILGIDPGTKESGYCLFDEHCKKIVIYGKLKNQNILNLISDICNKKYENFICLIEFLTGGRKLASSTLYTGIWIGMFIYHFKFKYNHLPILINRSKILGYFVPNRKIKRQELYGVVSSDVIIKKQMEERYGDVLIGNLSNDAIQALALITFFIEKGHDKKIINTEFSITS